MKKVIYFLILLLMPIIVIAYSDKIVVGGDTLGISVNSKGIIVIGLYKVDGELINSHYEVGDRIIKVNGIMVNTINDLVNEIENYSDSSSVNVTVVRNGKEVNDQLKLVQDNGNMKTGLYVKDNILGIGTLSYVDLETGIYGVLGHPLNISNFNIKMEIDRGVSYEANVTSFVRSKDGNPGSKNANIEKNKLFGSIERNSNYGIFGRIDSNSFKGEVMEVGKLDNVNLGEAYIYTTNEENKIDKYKIKIIDIDKKTLDKNIFFEIDDNRLLEMSGGIVQGMSGSPIIQNNKIIGAVTRVLVDNVERGYGISIVTMLEEGDKLLER